MSFVSSRLRFPPRVLLRLAAASALSLAAPFANALTIVPYSPAALAAAQQAGQPVVLHFHATWCPTCKAQDKAFDALKSDPSLKVTLMEADYDKEKPLEKQMKVNAQATLIVFHGATERSRVTGETDPARLKALLQSAI
jgi:thioredoxin 1